MRVCDVVINSIWFDPRVRRQINSYLENGIELSCVGYKCSRYNLDKVNDIPCDTTIVEVENKYTGPQKGIFRKLRREYLIDSAISNAIVHYKPDIIHANDLNALIPSYLAAKKLGCKLIYDSHEIYVENYTSKHDNFTAKVFKFVEKFLVHRIDLMVCVSNSAAEYFEEEYKIKRPLVVTNCAMKKDCCIKELNKEKSAYFEVLNHGQFYEGRGYDIMVDALPLISKVPQIRFALRGFGKMEGQLHRAVEKCENISQFCFYPPVNVEELIPLASHSNVGVAITVPICLNFKLSVSNKLFEYAAAGLPVIMSDIPEHRILNEKYNFGIILSENTPEDFADAVISLYYDKEKYSILSQNSINMSRTLNWENEFMKLIELEKRILN